jgi:anti-sigma-K factor RskA
MSERDHSPEDLTAAEYVLGVLDADGRRRAEARMAREPRFAEEVAFWEDRLGGLADGVRPVEPPLRTWQRIESALGRSAQARFAAGPTAERAPRAGLWNSLAFWRTLAFGTTGLAAGSFAALLLVALVKAPLPPPAAPLVAALGASAGQPGFVAAVSADRATLMIVPAALGSTEQRVPELWLVPADGRPRSLGVINRDEPARVTIPAELIGQVGAEASLAVSLEPAGGSPTGQPTGPVIAHGKLTHL